MISHDHPRFADPDYEPYPVRTDDYDGPDYQTEVLAEERREEALKREEQAPAQATAIENEQLIDEFRAKADNAYCDFIAKMRRDDCLGAPYKMEHGTFTMDNLKAFQEAYTLYGKHLAYSDAIKASRRQP